MYTFSYKPPFLLSPSPSPCIRYLHARKLDRVHAILYGWFVSVQIVLLLNNIMDVHTPGFWTRIRFHYSSESNRVKIGNGWALHTYTHCDNDDVYFSFMTLLDQTHTHSFDRVCLLDLWHEYSSLERDIFEYDKVFFPVNRVIRKWHTISPFAKKLHPQTALPSSSPTLLFSAWMAWSWHRESVSLLCPPLPLLWQSSNHWVLVCINVEAMRTEVWEILHMHVA